MNAPSSARLVPRRRLLAAALLASGMAVAGLHAQTAITSVTTEMITGTPTNVTADGQTVTFDNDQEAVIGFKTASTTYYALAQAQTALIDRDPSADTYAPNQLSLWYAYTGSATNPTYLGKDQTNANTALLGNNLLEGSDNLLTNNNGNTQSSGDVERLDFILTSTGQAATTTEAFAVFDRGNDTNHDSFKIAVITGIDSNGNPTSYGGELITVTPNDYDTSSNPVANENYTVFRYDNASNPDTLSAWDNKITGTGIASTDQSSQGVGGVVISLANLGIASGTTIYGYSIMAADVISTGTGAIAITTAISNELVNYMNTTYFPSNTSDNTSVGDGNYGGIDLMDINGVEFSTVDVTPEPSFYGAALLALSLGAFALRRRRPRPAAA